MPLTVFESACVVVVVLTLWTMSRARDLRAILRDYGVLAVAAWIGEDTSIALYRFYAYAPDWHLRVHHVPILVPLIWPLVILSAREVVSKLWPELGRSRPLRALAVGALVACDASLVEVVAVRANMWSWAEAGHLGVPLIGILGWGCFALGADLALSRKTHGRLATLIYGPLATHALILLLWWGLFRWTLRGALGSASVLGLAVLSALALVLVIRRRRAGQAIPLDIAMPRMIAASLFVALLVTTAPFDAALWTHAACVAVPYFAATSYDLTSLRGRRSPEDPPGSRSPSPR
jgi:hypothetical protein